MKLIAKTLLAASFCATLTVSAMASAFWPGTVINIATTDALNIRKWPAATSQILDAYPDGASISLTGRCKNIVTNASFPIDGGQSANWKYTKMKAANVWCQVMTDAAQLGWARGKYLWPQ